MAVPFTINTVWEVAGVLFWHLLLVGGGLVLAAIRSYKLTKLLYGWPSIAPNRFGYHLLWFVVLIQWTVSFFIIYWSPDPLAPTVPGTWDLWYLPLAFGALLPVVAFLVHLFWWIMYSWTAGFVFMIILLLWNIGVLVLYLLLAPGSLIAALLHIVSIVIEFYFILVFYYVMSCNRNVDIPSVWFCDELAAAPGACAAPNGGLFAGMQSTSHRIGVDIEGQMGLSVVKRAPIQSPIINGQDYDAVYSHGNMPMAHQNYEKQISSLIRSKNS